MPGYSSTMGPPKWVSSPIHGSMHAHSETEEYVRGVAIARLESFNNPAENLIAGIATIPMQAVTWTMLEAACLACHEYQLLHRLVEQGVHEESKDWDKLILPFHRHRHLITTIGPVVLINDRPVVPNALRLRIIDHYHAGHP